MKKNGAKKSPAFVSRAERAFARVARKLRSENRKLDCPRLSGTTVSVLSLDEI